MSMVELPLVSEPSIVVIMGVSGSGKSTIGEALAERMGARYLDGDDFHSETNRDKMRRGYPLSDTDRWPWLSLLGTRIRKTARAGENVVASCSALKKSYRQYLLTAIELPSEFVFLDGSRETLAQRIEQRTDHYMPIGLLDSQLSILERPSPEEEISTTSFELPLEEAVSSILSALKEPSKKVPTDILSAKLVEAKR